MKEALKNLPSLPGIYLFKAGEVILYIGKAKNIKKRVQSYFVKKALDWKIDALLAEYTIIEHIVTHSETDALLLEAQLIKEHAPKYNVLLKSGQPFVYLLFTNEVLPRLEIVRNKKQKGTYFGPFLHKKQARSVLNYILSTFRLKLCTTKIKQGCLEYHIGTCAGNCLETFDQHDYLFRLDLAQQLLAGNYKKSLAMIHKPILLYSTNFEFEKAKNLYNYEQNLHTIFESLRTRFSEKKYVLDVARTTAPTTVSSQDAHLVGAQLQKLLGLEKPIETIDCFDISHFQSSCIVGSCIRFKNGVPDKNNFRKFNIKSLTEQNDYAALQEIVQRRYKNPENLPDLMLIDGGKGQYSSIAKLFPTIPIIALAKREETIYGKNLPPEGIKLDVKTDVGKLLIALRDYAHHFAISFHRKKRSSSY